MLNLEDKCQTMQMEIDKFIFKLEFLRQKGLPNTLVTNDKLMTQEDYNKKMREVAKYQLNTSSMKDIPARKVLYRTFENFFYL